MVVGLPRNDIFLRDAPEHVKYVTTDPKTALGVDTHRYPCVPTYTQVYTGIYGLDFVTPWGEGGGPPPLYKWSATYVFLHIFYISGWCGENAAEGSGRAAVGVVAAAGGSER